MSTGNATISQQSMDSSLWMIGDTVEVIAGDLVGMRGKLVRMDGPTVKVEPFNVDLGTKIDLLVDQVRKYISVGAHVKVMAGRYANETGEVVALEQVDGDTDFTAVVLTDVTYREILVRTSQLHESAEVTSGQDRLSGYELYDLVVLSGGGSANEVGVIVRVGREDFTVVNNHGMARQVRPEELRGKRNNSLSKDAFKLDAQGNHIRVGDTVIVTEGPHKGKSATIKRISQTQLFLHSQTRLEHAGIFVVGSHSCVSSGSRVQNRGSAKRHGRMSPSPGGGRSTKRNRREPLVGKTVRILAGEYKGHIGTASDTTTTHVSVELHSRQKKVPVVRERVMVVGDKFGRMENPKQLGNEAGGPKSPAPMVGATPAIHGYDGATPSHESTAADEVWRPGGSVDQEAGKDNDGLRNLQA